MAISANGVNNVATTYDDFGTTYWQEKPGAANISALPYEDFGTTYWHSKAGYDNVRSAFEYTIVEGAVDSNTVRTYPKLRRSFP